MTPEYIDELADLADPDQLWRLPGLQQLDLPPEKRRQLDAGVALRRHAQHLRNLASALDAGLSWIITPFSSNTTATRTIETPPDHARLRSSITRKH